MPRANTRRPAPTPKVEPIEATIEAPAVEIVAKAIGVTPPLPPPAPKGVTKRKNKRETVYEKDPDTRRDRLLKRTLGAVRKILQLRRIVGDDMQFAFALSCRDPQRPGIGYNCFAASSEADPREILAEWTRRFDMEAARPIRSACFEKFGPVRDPDEVPPTLFSFPHRSIFPDKNGRGFRDGDPEDEEAWEDLCRTREAAIPPHSASPPPALAELDAPEPRSDFQCLMKRPKTGTLAILSSDDESNSDSSTLDDSSSFGYEDEDVEALIPISRRFHALLAAAATPDFQSK